MLELDALKTTLVGTKVKLVSLDQSHRQLLEDIAADERIWRFYPLKGNDKAEFNAWFDQSLKEAQAFETWPYAVYDRETNRVVGTTRYEFIVPEHDRLSVGGSWLHPDVWGGGYNPDMRYLLLENAFEGLNAHRVEIRVDGRNERNLAAWRSFGATEEGTLREIFKEAEGFRADRVVFSVLQNEWPNVRARIQAKRLRPGH